MGMSVNFKDVRHDAGLLSAAQTIDKHVGKKNDKSITADDLDGAQKLLEQHQHALQQGTPDKSPLKDLHPVAVKQLEANLPALRKLLHGETAEKSKQAGPYCTSVGVEAIAHDDVKAAAAAIAKALDNNGGKELSLASFLDARDVLAGKQTDGGPAETAKIKAALQKAIDDKVLSPKAMETLDVFFLTGQGGLLNHGPIKISGKEFDDVYRLSGDAKDADKLIAHFESRFAECGYDRIYLKGGDGALYLALHEKGELKNVKEGFRVSMRNEHDSRSSGEVLATVDVANTWTEATVGIWKKTFVKWGDSIANLFKSKAEKQLDTAGGVIVDGALGKGLSADQKKDLWKIGGAFAGLTAWGTLATVFTPALIGAAGAAVTLTGVSAVRYALSEKSVTAIHHELGVAVNQTGPQRA